MTFVRRGAAAAAPLTEEEKARAAAAQLQEKKFRSKACLSVWFSDRFEVQHARGPGGPARLVRISACCVRFSSPHSPRRTRIGCMMGLMCMMEMVLHSRSGPAKLA